VGYIAVCERLLLKAIAVAASFRGPSGTPETLVNPVTLHAG
jgi:hypothetical protein